MRLQPVFNISFFAFKNKELVVGFLLLFASWQKYRPTLGHETWARIKRIHFWTYFDKICYFILLLIFSIFSYARIINVQLWKLFVMRNDPTPRSKHVVAVPWDRSQHLLCERWMRSDSDELQGRQILLFSLKSLLQFLAWKKL